MLRISYHYVSKVVSALFFVEMIVLIASVYLAAMIRFFDDHFQSYARFEYFPLSACAFAVVMVFSMSAFGLYQQNFREDLRGTLVRLMQAFALGFGIITLVFYWMPTLYFGRGILIPVVVIAIIGISLTRILCMKSSELGFLESRILFLGGGELAKECSDLAINNMHHHKYKIVGFVPVPNEDCLVPAAAILSNEDSLIAVAKQYDASEIVVSVKNRRGGTFPIQQLLECKLNGIKVTEAATFFEREACQIRVDSLQPSWFVFGGGFDQSFLRTFIKRIFDLVVSMIILFITFPIMLIATVGIFVEDRGPIFYQQERVGKNGRTFMVLKFRSMRTDAEKEGTPKWAATDDARTTRVGRIIRKLRIDELPQLLNVFKGEMSFVGPRPERPYFVRQLTEALPFYNARHSLKPGITGLAQVRYQYGASIEDSLKKLQYDLYYVKNNSLFLDVLILIDTIQVVLYGKGSR